MMYSLRKGYNRVWKLVLYCSAFAAVGLIAWVLDFIALPPFGFMQHVIISFGYPHIFQVESLLHGLGCCQPDGHVIRTERPRHMCTLCLYWVALVVVDLTRHLSTPEGLLSMLQAGSLLGRLGISPWLCEAGVRQDSM